MPIVRKQQILQKIETSEGISANPGAGDAEQIFEPSIPVDDTDVQDRVPASPSLSRDFATIGRQTRTITFKSDLRGSGDVTIPITLPGWANNLQACGYKAGSLRRLTLGAVTGTGFQIGEIISQSAGAIRAVVLAVKRAGVPRLRGDTAGDILWCAEVVGTLTAAATTGESSASTSTASAAAAGEGVVYQPTSEKLVNVTTGAWSGTPPAAVGEILAVLSAGVPVGAVQVIVDNGTMTDMDVTLLYGSMLNGDTLRSAALGTAVISADPVQIRTPSLTIRHNLDGRRRDLLGSRGDFTLAGEVGGPMQFDWSYTGDLGPRIDALPIATSGLSTIRPPRLLGALCAHGLGAELFRMPTKSVSLANGGTVSPNLDANRTGGSTGSNVTDRDPRITVGTDDVHSAFDWEAARDNGTVIRASYILGTTPGNTLVLVAPICQVVGITPRDADGVSVFDVELAPRRIQESGDDEFYIAQI